MKTPVFFLSFDESNADANWLVLQKKAPHAERISGVTGIVNAHRACAERSGAKMMFIVDGDNEVLDSFDFSYEAAAADSNAVHVWRCQNAVNDLVYGYGGVKLYPREALQGRNAKVDLATSAARYKVMPELASITRFNTTPFHAWRSAFRECVKLASAVIDNQKGEESRARLHVWCTAGHDRPFGEWAIAGALEGKTYGLAHRRDFNALGKINDFAWLEGRFHERRARA